MPRASRGVSPGHQQASLLMLALETLRKVLNPGARDLPVLTGLTPTLYLEPQENVHQKALQILRDSKRVYVYGNDVVMEMTKPNSNQKVLENLRTSNEVHRSAASLLANLIVCEKDGKQIPIPDFFVQQLFRNESVLKALPYINTYTTRPVFDVNYRLCGPGWHPESGILVHGSDIEPYMEECQIGAEQPLDRMPPFLRKLLQGFCLKEAADVANAIAMLLTGLLNNLFVQMQKATCIVDGNQPGLGKTLMVRLFGMILDGRDPMPIPFNPNDEELAKVICAKLRGQRESLLLIDNCKLGKGAELSSPTLESNSTAARISLRILGASKFYEQDNDILWFLTMNNTKACRDMVSRSCFIRHEYEGKPETRPFVLKDPMAFAREHRLQILGELAGMVFRWNQQGRPLGHQQHRQHQWAEIIGGILNTSGFPEFLANASDAAANCSTDIEQLATLAEAVIKKSLSGCTPEQCLAKKVTPEETTQDWFTFCEQAQLFADQPNAAKGSHSKSIRIGKFLSPLVGREVEFDVFDLVGRATLRSRKVRANTKLYHFEIHWDEIQVNNVACPSVPAVPAASASARQEQPAVPSALPPQSEGPQLEGGNTERW